MTKVIEVRGRLDEENGHRIAVAIRSAAGQIVNLCVDSEGGRFGTAIDVALEIEEHDQAVVASVLGEACSAAALIVLAADKRRIHRDATIMMHYPSSRHWASPEECKAACEHMERIVGEYVTAHSSDIRTWLARERFFTAHEALAAGLVDSIVTDARSLPVYLTGPTKRRPTSWLREYRDLFERHGIRSFEERGA